jgi:hypothetical protein
VDVGMFSVYTTATRFIGNHILRFRRANNNRGDFKQKVEKIEIISRWKQAHGNMQSSYQPVKTQSQNCRHLSIEQ